MALLSLPDCPLAVRRKLNVFAAFLIAAHFAQHARSAALHIGCPHLLLRFFVLTGRIGYVTFAIELGSAGIDDSLAVGGKPERDNVLPVVAVVMRHLARREAGGVGDPHVAFSPGVENPGDAVGLTGRGQSRRERRADNLLQGEASFLRQSANRACEYDPDQSKVFHRRNIIHGRSRIGRDLSHSALVSRDESRSALSSPFSELARSPIFRGRDGPITRSS